MQIPPVQRPDKAGETVPHLDDPRPSGVRYLPNNDVRPVAFKDHLRSRPRTPAFAKSYQHLRHTMNTLAWHKIYRISRHTLAWMLLTRIAGLLALSPGQAGATSPDENCPRPFADDRRANDAPAELGEKCQRHPLRKGVSWPACTSALWSPLKTLTSLTPALTP